MPHAKRTATGVLGGLLGLVGLSAVAGVLVTATVTPALAVSGYAASGTISLFDNLPGYLEVDAPMLPTTIYGSDAVTHESYPLATFYDQNREPLAYEELGQTIVDAIISSEDPRYYEHGGVDLIGTTRAAIVTLSGADTQGGSSISQQYVKNVLIQRCEQQYATGSDEQQGCYLQHTQSSGIEGYKRKLQEMRYAISVEQEYSKDAILLGYLNIANFGGTTYGIEAAAKYYFGVSAKDLSLAQAATLAGIVQNPNYYRIDMPDGSYTKKDGTRINGEADGWAETKDRRNYVLTRMHEDGKITDEEYKAAWDSPIVPEIHERVQGCATAGGSAYFCQYVKRVIETDPAFGDTEEERRELLRRGGLSIYTTLDLRVQIPAEEAMRAYAPTQVEGMNFGASTVTLEAGTGRILSLTQNTEFDERENPGPGKTSLVYAADYELGRSSGFSTGSTFKVFTLLDWLEKGHSIREVLNGVNRNAFTGFHCDGAPITQERKIGNFANSGGYTGPVINFTRDSLNSGYLAMGARLNLCDILRVADRLGATTADGKPLATNSHFHGPFGLLGSENIAPLAMASVYATIANNGMQCEPKAIDRVTDSQGAELAVPEQKCEQKIAPEVAATAAAALETVMTAGNGTGRPANNFDGVPVIGKTGTNELDQTALVQSSTKATTYTWVGNADSVDTDGDGIGDYKADLFQTWANGRLIKDIRFVLSRDVQRAANEFYGGGQFPPPDPNLNRTVLVDLPDVVGKPIAEAEQTLRNAGFQVQVGAPVPGRQPADHVESQDPGAGRVAGGTTVTISPSNGEGAEVPDVSGQSPESALAAVRAAGFSNAQLGECEQSRGAGAGRATGTSPAAGTVTSKNTSITIDYARARCGGGGDGDDD